MRLYQYRWKETIPAPVLTVSGSKGIISATARQHPFVVECKGNQITFLSEIFQPKLQTERSGHISEDAAMLTVKIKKSGNMEATKP